MKGHELKDKEGLLDWLLGVDGSAPVERSAVDGFYNNPFLPEQGAFGIPVYKQFISIHSVKFI